MNNLNKLNNKYHIFILHISYAFPTRHFTALAGEKLRELPTGLITNMTVCVNNFYTLHQWAKNASTGCVYFGDYSKYGKICAVSILQHFPDVDLYNTNL